MSMSKVKEYVSYRGNQYIYLDSKMYPLTSKTYT
jgi:hypothetical protein